MEQLDRGPVAARSRPRAAQAGWVEDIWPRARTPEPARRPVEAHVYPERTLVEFAELHDCGNGTWCEECRREIKAEALRWIRELNTPTLSWELSSVSMPLRTWHSELLLGDR